MPAKLTAKQQEEKDVPEAKQTTTWWFASRWSIRIESAEVESETGATVTINGKRRKKNTQRGIYYATLKEAVAHGRRILESRVARKERELAEARAALAAFNRKEESTP